MKDILESKSDKELKTKKLDRIVLDSDSAEAIKNIMSQVQSELGSLIQVSPKLIGNFLLKKRSAPLSFQELEDLRIENHDVVKALKIATVAAIKAKQNGSELDLNTLLRNIQTPSVIQKLSSKNPRGRKPRANTSSDLDQKNKSNTDIHNAFNSAKNAVVQNQISGSETKEITNSNLPFST